MTNQYQDAWLAGAVGRRVDLDGDDSYDCVDVPKDYAQSIWAGTTWRQVWPGAGNAKDMIDTVDPAYCTVTRSDPNDAAQIPAPGDIIVYAGNAANPYGHIAVVKAADQNGVDVIQQDTNTQQAMALGHLAYTNQYTGPCSGWLTPIFVPDPFTGLPESGPAVATNQEKLDAIYDAIFNGGSSMPEGIPLKDLIKNHFTDLETAVGKIPTTAPAVTLTDTQVSAIAKQVAADLPATDEAAVAAAVVKALGAKLSA